MWCTQSKHNFTGSEFAWDADYLLDPGFEYACPNRACCWDRANTLRRSTDPGCVTGAHLLLVGPPPYGHHLRTGKHPGCCYWRSGGSLFTLWWGGLSYTRPRSIVFWAHSVLNPVSVMHSVVLVSWVLCWDWEQLNELSHLTCWHRTEAGFEPKYVGPENPSMP